VHSTGQDGQTTRGADGIRDSSGSSSPPARSRPTDQRIDEPANQRTGEPSPAGSSRPTDVNMPGQARANMPSDAKSSLRAQILARRKSMTSDERALAGRQLRDALLELPEMQMAGTVAAYVSIGTEPDTRGLIFALWKRGTYVLLPLLRSGGDLDWASYEGPESLAPKTRGLLEPTEPPRGVSAVTSADMVIVPALAVDRQGRRLGRGGGSYDRALARVGANILTVALLYDGELADEVPVAAHDMPVRAVALPGEGISRLR
jgi:5-formyltetrahydrofolate cyclo-ligase